LTDWASLAHIHTLVMMMAVKRVGAICTALIKAGRAPDTPAAAIHAGTTDQQQTVRATLATLADRMVDQGITSPAVIIVGEVVAFHDTLAWFKVTGEASGFIPAPQHQ